MTTDQTTDLCNALLRGEISAIETYDQAIEKISDSPGVEILEDIQSDHEQSVAELREYLVDHASEVSEGSGWWGSFVQALEGAAKVLGTQPALKLLREGEEHGVREYEKALAHPEISAAARVLIQQKLLPPLLEHIEQLEELEDNLA
jgi:rubrerythrin